MIEQLKLAEERLTNFFQNMSVMKSEVIYEESEEAEHEDYSAPTGPGTGTL